MKKLFSGLLLTALLVGSLLLPLALSAQEPAPYTVTLHQLEKTCKNSDETNAKATVRADTVGMVTPKGRFHWQQLKSDGWDRLPGLHVPSPLSAVGLLADTWYRLVITDTILVHTLTAEGLDTIEWIPVQASDSVLIEAYPQPNIQITCEPGDTVYIQNPDVTFSFENLPLEDGSPAMGLYTFFWTFENELTSTMDRPVFTYVETKPDPYEVKLTVTDDCGCETTFTKEVFVNPVKLKIPNVFTPNGDDANETWVITLDDGNSRGGGKGGRETGMGDKTLSDFYKSSELVVMNRWGRIVYHQHNYENDWDGGNLPDGTYYYILKCKGLKEEVQYQGVVMILRH